MNAFAQPVVTGTPDLLARAQSGEREAFTELVQRHHDELVRISFAITGDLDAARDAAQLAWIKAWQKLGSVREPERLRTWLIAIAANEARQQIRSSKRRRVREIAPVVAHSSDSASGTVDHLDLSAALSRLDADDRRLLALRYLAGMTAEEIGPAIGLSGSGVRTRLSRLVAQLREELSND
ncbi:MAG TPA: sigma-70 family RNA polymerase sigma factor [Candidatus Limnocylindria bacterium]|nr:sigma-70 family RNA polymerase sigma factor [Candidatus Limnocylindria bacterium]